MDGPEAHPDGATDQGACVLEARGLVVEYPGVRALDRVDFEVRAGEVHALMGENGAGKSTLVRVLSGMRRADAGSVLVGGREVRARSAREAEAAGISTVHQEIDLIPTMTVADNICLGRGVTRWGLVDRRSQRRRAEAALERLGVRLEVGRLLEEHSIALQQMVAIARALDVRARLLILDEPTSSLDAGETRALLGVLRRLRADGLGIVFITHFLGQAYEIADRITVLRNAVRVGTWRAAELPRGRLVEAMTGKAIVPGAGKAAGGHAVGSGAPALAFKRLGRRGAVAPASGEVRAGEALGLAGLLGSGRSELARLLFGADRADSGEVRAGGQRVRAGSVADSVRHGVAFAPEDRKGQGLVLELSVAENILLALQARRGALRPIARRERARLVEHYIRSLNIRAPGPGTPVGSLSGGNQQKVLLARWLATQPKALILDEPARGIDVGARAEIESLIADLKAQGLAVVLVSSELDELARVCDRVLVLRDRAVVGELTGEAVSEGAMLGMIARPAGVAEGGAGASRGE